MGYISASLATPIKYYTFSVYDFHIAPFRLDQLLSLSTQTRALVCRFIQASYQVETTTISHLSCGCENVRRSASLADIKAAYKRFALKLHPDVTGGHGVRVALIEVDR
jgi:curved DNA-binding protein CbpA